VSSSSTTDPPPGFTVVSTLGTGSRGITSLALQDGLERRVALKVYGAGAPRGAWPEHPGVARLFVSGETYTAVQYVPGGSLAARLDARDITRDEALALCDQAAATLHAVGVPHGAVHAANVLIGADGRALLCDFGMPGVDATAAADRAALVALRERCAQLPVRRGSRRASGVAAAAVVAVSGVAALALVTSGGGAADEALTPLRGAVGAGSALTHATRTVGCDGRPPAESATTCTIVQVRRDGRPLAFARDGVVRRWAVRGARGELALQIVRPLANGQYTLATRAQTQDVRGSGRRTFATDIAVRRGDLLAVEVAPGAGVGIEPQARGAAVLRFEGPLSHDRRRPTLTARAVADDALALRVDVVRGARPRAAPTLRGAAARVAPAGRTVLERERRVAGGRRRTIRIVVLARTVAVDLLGGTTRLARVTITGADPRGTLTSRVDHLFPPYDEISWRNPDGREVVHRYRATTDAVEQAY